MHMDEQALSSYYARISAEQDRNNAWSAEQAQKAMDYQERMSNTAHQREVQDLIAAGLNPVLSAGGSGATTGSGVAASAGNENVTALYGLIKTAIDANMKQAEAMQNQAQAVAEADSSSGSSGISSGKGSLEGVLNPEQPSDLDLDVPEFEIDDKAKAYFEFADGFVNGLTKAGVAFLCSLLHVPQKIGNWLYETCPVACQALICGSGSFGVFSAKGKKALEIAQTRLELYRSGKLKDVASVINSVVEAGKIWYKDFIEDLKVGSNANNHKIGDAVTSAVSAKVQAKKGKSNGRRRAGGNLRARQSVSKT